MYCARKEPNAHLPVSKKTITMVELTLVLDVETNYLKVIANLMQAVVGQVFMKH
jgi:hypothetical protein